MPRASFAKLRDDDAKDYSKNLTISQQRVEEIKEYVLSELLEVEHPDGYAKRVDFNEPYWRGYRTALHNIQNKLNKL